MTARRRGPKSKHKEYVSFGHGSRDTKGAIALRQLGNEIRATLEKAPERADLRWVARTEFFSEPLIREGARLTHPSGAGGKGQQRSLGRDSNQFSDLPLMEDLTITISVIEGPSKGLVYEMKRHCITLGRLAAVPTSSSMSQTRPKYSASLQRDKMGCVCMMLSLSTARMSMTSE
jgi:hypothetical protein